MTRAGKQRRWRSRAVRPAAVVALAFALAACGGAAEEPTVATAGSRDPGPTASATAASGTIGEYVDNQRQLAKCLREHGLEVPDPDAKGRLDIAAGMGGRKKTDPGVLAAWKACKEFEQPVPAELQEREAPVTAEQLANRRTYAKCMRANGMPDWPDPRPDGSWPEIQGGEQSPQEQRANIFALQICEPVLDGRPPTTPNPNATGVG
jgi:hypothetical protein